MRHIGWVLVAVVATLQVIVGTSMLLGDRHATFGSDTGVPWVVLTSTYPTVADQVDTMSVATLTGTVVIGSLALFIAVFALRTRQRWAWFALWLLPLWMLPGIVSLLAVERFAVFGYFGLTLVGVTSLGLLLSAPHVFDRRRAHTSQATTAA
ncbi:hypothetical protein P0L94_08050 [Microbacter sp. GSS18]|nr:hypothetical protein P0L94_08050 [Microbacter sp. GSS18]